MGKKDFIKSMVVITGLLLHFNLWGQTPPITLHVATAGTLSSLIAGNKKYEITDLTLTGNLDSRDIRFIREMAGRDYTGKEVANGKLSKLNLAGANIVAYRKTVRGTNDSNETTTCYYQAPYYTYNGVVQNYTCYHTSNETLSEYMFYGCTKLTSITIPNSVTSIEQSAFPGCSGLKEFIVSEQNKYYSSTDGVLLNKNKTAIICFPAGKSGSYTIPNSVTKIEFAFLGCSGLTSITIPNSVTSIGQSAFLGCSGLTSITIPNSVTLIGQSAFLGCSGLTSITIPNSVTSIGYNAFSGCSGLTSVTIPNSVTGIGDRAFSECTKLTSITIPNSIKTINMSTFKNCTGLTSITIPNSVTSIGDSIFYGCTKLTEIHSRNPIPPTAKSICFYVVNHYCPIKKIVG